jgi:mRNA-degrading endonuclease RelE of RelBE toxin-antitoxin system
MKYSISWTDPAKKSLGKLSKPIAQRIFDKVKSLEDDPHRMVERCEGYPYVHQRVGAYRVILKIDDSTLLISVIKVGPRKKVYDR